MAYCRCRGQLAEILNLLEVCMCCKAADQGQGQPHRWDRRSVEGLGRYHSRNLDLAAGQCLPVACMYWKAAGRVRYHCPCLEWAAAPDRIAECRYR